MMNGRFQNEYMSQGSTKQGSTKQGSTKQDGAKQSRTKSGCARRLCIILVILSMLSVAVCGCGQSDAVGSSDESGVMPAKKDNVVYDIGIDGMHIVEAEYNPEHTPQSDTLEECVKECLDRLMSGPEDHSAKAAIDDSITDVMYHIEDGLVSIDFPQEYYDATPTVQILRRAAIVKSLCNIEGVTGVSLMVSLAPVTDSMGIPIGVMNADSFVENNGNEINSYERANLHLFFANDTGDALVETVESVVYSSNISMEHLITSHIIEGPNSVDVFPVVEKNVQVNSVSVQDGICYVDLGSEFLKKNPGLSDEVVVYSFVDSLTQLTGVSKVKVLVDGAADVSFGSVNLSAPLERNLDIVE